MDIQPFKGFAAQHYLWFDPQHNGGTTPQTNDYQLVGYSPYPDYDYEKKRTGSGWVKVNKSGWIIAKTVLGGSEAKIEFAISFSKIEISASINKTLGFMIGCGEIPNPYWHRTSTVFNDYLISNN
jgi:hypothetical protein